MRVLRWPGAKWSIANEIIDLMPKHKIYVEPFFGSGAVFFTKAKCNLEILNDLDSEIVNLFNCIRDNPEELSRMVQFTPYSREEYNRSYKRSGSDIERARQFLVRVNMARAGMQYYSSSWRHAGPVMGKRCSQRVTGEWNRMPDRILESAARLKEAEIENTSAIELIKKYNQPECLLYVDPPYLLSTRKQRYYNEEMTEEKEHEELIDVLKQHKGPVLLSGYDSELYNKLLVGWNKREIKSQAEQGKKRVEVVWANYELSNQITMFG